MLRSTELFELARVPSCMDDKEDDVFLVLTGVEVFRGGSGDDGTEDELRIVTHKSKRYNKIIECVL